MNLPSQIFFGFSLPFKGLKLILKTPKLMLLSLIPVTVTAGTYFFIILKLQAAMSALVPGWLAYFGLSGDHWLGFGLVLLTQLILILVSAFTFSFVATIIASPFNDFLAEATETVIGLKSEQHLGGFRYKARLILIDVTKSVVTTAFGVLAILISWVPALNIIALTTAWLLLCFQFVSYPQTRRGVGLLEGAQFLLKNFIVCVSFGASLSICFAIHFLSILILPSAVVGGTMLFASRAQNKLQAGLEGQINYR